MKFRWPLFIALTALWSGCSWISEVLLINMSGDVVVVRYTNAEHNVHPVAYSVERWNADSVPFLGDTVKIVWRKESDSTFYVELPKDKALIIAQGMNLDMTTGTQAKELLGIVHNLEVLKPNDEVIACSGEGCYPRTKSFSRARAGIIIR